MRAPSLPLLSLFLGLCVALSTSTPAQARSKEVTIYVNGTDATGIKDFTFKAVDVRIDSEGNVWIDAPRYRIAVNKPAESASTEPASQASASQAPAAAVEPGHHWLVTQDQGSTGQVIAVLVNGMLVREIRSGQAQIILDIGEFLKPGSNVVTFRPMGSDTPPSGALTIHLGEGDNDSGTLKMQNPQISYTRTGTEPEGDKSVEYVVK